MQDILKIPRSLTPPLRSRGHFRSEVPVQGEAGERDQARGHELHPLLLGAGLAAAAPQVMGTGRRGCTV